MDTSALEWIKVAEQLPTVDQDIVVLLEWIGGDRDASLGFLRKYQGKLIWEVDASSRDWQVIAWWPYPQV